MSCDNYVIEDSMLCLHRQGTLNFKTNKSIIYVLKRTKKKCDSGNWQPLGNKKEQRKNVIVAKATPG